MICRRYPMPASMTSLAVSGEIPISGAGRGGWQCGHAQAGTSAPFGDLISPDCRPELLMAPVTACHEIAKGSQYIRYVSYKIRRYQKGLKNDPVVPLEKKTGLVLIYTLFLMRY